jgi:hypothetical protein
MRRFKGPTPWEVFWLATLGPFFVVGWLVLHTTKQLNRLAAYWCRFLLSVYPEERS